MKVIAHRGASAVAPENTMPAFRAASDAVVAPTGLDADVVLRAPRGGYGVRVRLRRRPAQISEP